MKKFFLLNLRLLSTLMGLIVFVIVFPKITKAQYVTVDRTLSPCSANWWAWCCKCDSGCVVVDPRPAFGYCRECTLLCPDCRNELGNLDQALEKLKGKNRGLKEAYDAFEKAYAETLEKYNNALERTYGKEGWGLTGLKGSFGGWWSAQLSYLSNFTKNANRALAVTTNAISIYQSGGTPSVDMGMTWSGVLFDVFGDDWVQKWFQNQSETDARNIYRQNIRKGMPVDVAKDIYKKHRKSFSTELKGYKKISDKGNTLLDIIGLVMATNTFVNDVFDIKENNRDAKAIKKQMKAISDSIVKNVDLMTCIRETQDSLKSGPLGLRIKNPISRQTAISNLATAIFWQISKYSSMRITQASIPKYAIDSVWEINEYKIESALATLKQLKTLQERILNRIDNDLLPYLVPWIDQWKDVKPAILLQMLKKAKASLAVFESECGKMKPLAESIYEDLKEAITGYEIDYLADNSNNFEIIPSSEITTGKKTEEGNTPGGTDKWTMHPNEKIKGEFGRVNMSYPAGVDWSIDFHTPENKYVTNRSSFSKHKPFYDIAPGNYNITLNHAIVKNVPVEKGKEVKLKFGILSLVTRNPWELYNESKEKYYTSGIKPVKMALPIGVYQLKFENKFYRVVIKEGATVKFELPIPDFTN